MTPAEDYLLARTFVAQVVAGNISGAEQSLSTHMKADETHKGLEALTAVFKHGEIKSFEVVGLFFRTGVGNHQAGRSTEMAVQMELSTGWFAGTVLTTVEEGNRKILAAHFQSIPDSLEKLNALNLMNKPLLALLFLLFVIAVPLFSLYALVLCFRTRMKGKWLWIVFILMGLTTLRLNWTTGEVGFQLLSFQVLGASFFRSGLAGPWVFGVSVPLGALLFLRKRRRLLKQAEADAAEVDAAASAMLVGEGGMEPRESGSGQQG